jgi:hypothetical protein
MTDPAPAPQPAPPTASPPAPTLTLTEDQTSGRMFVRWNLVTLLVGVVAIVLGLLASRGAGAP